MIQSIHKKMSTSTERKSKEISTRKISSTRNKIAPTSRIPISAQGKESKKGS
jgi:hypothetical protein